jgi:hypothetical protein
MCPKNRREGGRPAAGRRPHPHTFSVSCDFTIVNNFCEKANLLLQRGRTNGAKVLKKQLKMMEKK